MKIRKIEDICTINPKIKNDLPLKSLMSFVPMSAVSTDGNIDLTDTLISSESKGYTLFQDGDILFAKITPCMENGKGAIAHGLLNGYGAGSTEFIVLRPNTDCVTAKWLYLYLSQRSFRWKCQQHMTGSAGQKRVPAKYLASCEIPIPIISEQDRIVSKIEELFSKLDASVAELQTAKEKLKVYRQAVLKEALSPEQGWDKYHFADLMESVRNGYGKKPDDKGEYRILRISSVRPGKVDLSDFRCNQTPFNEDDLISENDLLFTRYNGSLEYVGVCACVPQLKEKYAYPDKIIRCTPKLKNSYHSKFLQYYMNQGDARKFIRSKIKTTSGQKGIAGSDIKKTIVWLPGLSEQESIVKKIDAKLSACDSIEQTVDATLQQAEALRQSILKQAFEGKI